MADPSKINSLVIFKGKKVSTEKIDERILELLGLQDEYELSYEEYIGYLREAMVASRMSKSRYSTAETESITNEWKRVKSKKGRFRPKKISAESFKKGSAVGINLNKQKALKGTKPLALSPANNNMTGGNEITTIIDALGEIIKSLTQQNKDAKKASDDQRKKGEQSRRAGVESKLEKGFGIAQKIAEKIIAPVKSLLKRIWDFFTAVFLGRAVYLLLDWFGKKENQEKVRTITRFLKDWWPALVGGFVLFGTKFGKGVRVLTRIALSGIGKLAKAIPALLRFGKNNPKSAAAIAAGAWATTQLAQRAFGGGQDSESKVEVKAHGGGHIRIPKFNGGGFNGGFRNLFDGLVVGEKGVDKIPAWLSNGEFVFSPGAVNYWGVDQLMSMNAAGGGTNKPKIQGGATYAIGGGPIGDIPLSTAYGTNPNDNTLRQAARMFSQNGKFGVEEDLFKTFKKLGGVADFEKMVGGKQNFQGIQQGMHGADDALDAIRRSAIEKLKGANKPQSSTRIGSALDNTTSALDDLIKSNKRGLRDTGFKLGFRTAPENRMLPAAGESSANAMRAAQKAAQNVRSPIPASRAIVPYAGGRLATQPMQQITTNMKVPGGRGGGGLTSAILMSLLEIFKPQIQSAVGSLYNSMGIGIGNLSDAKLKKQIEEELKMQKNINSMGIVGEDINGQSDRLSLLQQEANRRNIKGGAIKGGYGLKDESFKDAPKTQIMSDDKGRFFVGYKAM